MSDGGFTLTVLGAPEGKDRARSTSRGGHHYTPRKTTVAEREVRAAWEGVGEPRLEGAIYLDVSLHHERPAGHFTKAGALSAEGARHPWPDTKKPDVDNALKLVMDALNTRAWRDDKQVVRATVIRCWALRAHTLVQARRAPAPHPHL